MSWGTKKTREKEKELIEIATGQGGYFTAKQALKCGFSHRIQKYHVETTHWIKEDRGLFRFGFLYSKYDEFFKAVFLTRDRNDIPQGVISHESALFIHELGEIIPSKVHITVPVKFRKKITDKKYSIFKENLELDEIEQKEGIRLTTPIKTVIDVFERIDLEQIEKILREAHKKGLISQHEIETSRTQDEIKRKLLKVFSRHK